MRLSVFASGSSGNCALISEGDTHLLLDAGISMKRIRTALAAHGLTPEQLAGVLITHEHNDHIAGLPMLCRHHGVAVFAPRTVANHLRWSAAHMDGCVQETDILLPFSLGSLTVTAFPTSHDTDQSVGYRLEGSTVFGFCTDSGCVTPVMRSALEGCHAALIEANHDPDMLRSGPYPVYLKRRILSDRGHLSNADCAALACHLAGNGAHTLVLGHLSRENNLPSLAKGTVRRALDEAGFSRVRLEIGPMLGDLTMEIVPCCE